MKKATIKLSMFTLAMLNVAAVMSLRGLPLLADTGMQMLFYLFFAAFLFLIPSALVSAELATGWPKDGGVYRWVKEAFGARFGFLAIWLQWIQNVVWFPIVLAFAAVTIAFALKRPELADNNLYIVLVIVGIYWLATFINFFGIKVAGSITMAGVILGTILPGIFIIALGTLWIIDGNKIAFLQENISFFPNLSDFSNVAFLSGVILLFAGIEIGAVHVRELNKPLRDYPRAIFLATIIILIVFVLGALSIATVLPSNEISLTAGIMFAFDKMLQLYHLQFLLPIIGILITFGAVGGVMAWIAGPSKGLLATAESGEIPPFLAHTNKYGVQVNILILQGIIVTLLASLYLIMDNVDTAFFLLSAMTINLYLVMYMLLFAAGISLRYTKPNVSRSYKIPGGKNWGMLLIAGIGFVAVMFSFCISFIPPTQLQVGTPALYSSLVVLGLITFTGTAFIIHAFKKPTWLKHINNKR
jgi:putative glutamate/gamma-aminobutyrate antiporter